MSKSIYALLVVLASGCSSYQGSYIPTSAKTTPKPVPDHFVEDGATIYRTAPTRPYEVLGKYFYSDTDGSVFKQVARVIKTESADAAIKITAQPLTDGTTTTKGATWHPTGGGLGLTSETTHPNFSIRWEFEIIRWTDSTNNVFDPIAAGAVLVE